MKEVLGASRNQRITVAQSFALVMYSLFYFFIRLRMATSPINPLPSSQAAAGMETAAPAKD